MPDSRPYLSDAMAFLETQANPPIANSDLRLDLLQLTAAPPFVKDGPGLLAAVKKCRATIESQSKLRIVGTATQLSESRTSAEPKTSIVLGLQHPPTDGSRLTELFEAGIRVCQIAYDYDNIFGGGFAGTSGLTTEGKYLLEEMAVRGMILDLAHANARTADEALEFILREAWTTRLPVMISHTGSRKVYNFNRNTSTETMLQVERMRGVIGLYTLSFGLSDIGARLSSFIDHLELMAQTVSAENIVLGTDGIYQMVNLKAGEELFAFMKSKVDPKGDFRARFPTEASILNSPWKMEILHDTIARLLSPAYASGVCGENLYRFFLRSLPK